ncbi:MAG: hypothetical protein DDT32_02026 [Syntrophomonadaceae bacterium]|nr:hypothetical protein [Bacillota bacterium]
MFNFWTASRGEWSGDGTAGKRIVEILERFQ